KYAIGLNLTDAGFDRTVLCEFRARLIARSLEQRLLDALLDRCRERNWIKARGRQRMDSTHVLARIRPPTPGMRERDVAAHAQHLGGGCSRVVATFDARGVGGARRRAL